MSEPSRREALCGACALAVLSGCDGPMPSPTDSDAPTVVPTEPGPTDPYPCEVLVGDESEGWVRFGYDDHPELAEVQGHAYVQVGTLNLVLAQVEPGCFVCIERRCTHEGVLIDYRAARNGFVCPRHGAVYAWDGRVLGGPAPRDLPVYAAGERDGAVWVLLD